jgi:hypothetical protein
MYVKYRDPRVCRVCSMTYIVRILAKLLVLEALVDY